MFVVGTGSVGEDVSSISGFLGALGFGADFDADTVAVDEGSTTPAAALDGSVVSERRDCNSDDGDDSTV